MKNSSRLLAKIARNRVRASSGSVGSSASSSTRSLKASHDSSRSEKRSSGRAGSPGSVGVPGRELIVDDWDRLDLAHGRMISPLGERGLAVQRSRSCPAARPVRALRSRHRPRGSRSAPEAAYAGTELVHGDVADPGTPSAVRRADHRAPPACSRSSGAAGEQVTQDAGGPTPRRRSSGSTTSSARPPVCASLGVEVAVAGEPRPVGARVGDMHEDVADVGAGRAVQLEARPPRRAVVPRPPRCALHQQEDAAKLLRVEVPDVLDPGERAGRGGRPRVSW